MCIRDRDYDLLLYSNSSETRNRLVNTSSRIGLLFLIDVIYYAFIAKYYPEYFERYNELRAVSYTHLDVYKRQCTLRHTPSILYH